MTSYPILYSFRRCPYAMRARFALYTAEIGHEHREIELKNKPSAMLEISPKGTVPVLQLLGGQILEESIDIMKWAGKNPVLSKKIADLIHENDTTFKYALDRYKYPGRYGEEEGINYSHQCEQFLKKLECSLFPFLEGETPSFGDMAVFPFIRQYAMVDPEKFKNQPYFNLHKWLDYFLNHDIFQHMMHKHPVWLTQSSPILITF